jgi:multimeric flavodoxin WrbA
MKFLVINASPHKDGGTQRFVDAFCDAADKVESVTKLNLHDNPPSFCKGGFVRPDVLDTYQQAVLACDALFIATPTYWFNVPSILKAFIENLTPIESDLWQRPRTLGVAVYAPEGGELGCATAIILPLNHLGFSLVDSGYVYHRGIPKDDWAWEDIGRMPERMKRLIQNRTQ